VTFLAREFSRRRLGAVRRDDRTGQPSAVIDLGEAAQTAVQRGLPLLLSTEAAGHLADTVRVGRMEGRPGALTITTSATKLTLVSPSVSLSTRVPSIGWGPSTIWVCRWLGRSNCVNSTTCSNSLRPGTLVHSRTR
jgi:hypothetical protein